MRFIRKPRILSGARSKRSLKERQMEGFRSTSRSRKITSLSREMSYPKTPRRPKVALCRRAGRRTYGASPPIAEARKPFKRQTPWAMEKRSKLGAILGINGLSAGVLFRAACWVLMGSIHTRRTPCQWRHS